MSDSASSILRFTLNDSLSFQSHQFFLTHAQPSAVNLLIMFSQQRSWLSDFPGGRGKFIQCAWVLEWVGGWVVNSSEEATRLEMCIVEQIAHGRNWRNRHPA